jgi:hypothetical protein
VIDIINEDNEVATSIIDTTRRLAREFGLFEGGAAAAIHIAVKCVHSPESPFFVKKNSIAPAAPSILKESALEKAGLLNYDNVVRQEISLDSIQNCC